MFNAFDPQGARDGHGPERAERGSELPMADREVPIGFAVTPAGVHEWLDGEAAETDVRRSETTRHVEFWNRLNAEVTVRREMKTPVHVQAAIMAAIMPTAQAAPVTQPWHQRALVLSPATAIAAAAGLVALGAVVGFLAVTG